MKSGQSYQSNTGGAAIDVAIQPAERQEGRPPRLTYPDIYITAVDFCGPLPFQEGMPASLTVSLATSQGSSEAKYHHAEFFLDHRDEIEAAHRQLDVLEREVDLYRDETERLTTSLGLAWDALDQYETRTVWQHFHAGFKTAWRRLVVFMGSIF